METEAFLRRIGISSYDGPPSLEGLSQLHEAFVDQVPYETVQYQLTPGGPLEPEESAQRIIAREAGGYCFQLNGAFSLLLTQLGYRVNMHRGGAQTPNRAGDVDASHMVLTVSGLVEDPGRLWMVDAGLGESLVRPLPLEEGTAYQEPFDLRLRPSEKVDGWRLDHDPRSSLIGMDFEAARVGLDAFAEQHANLSTSPASPFRRVASAFRRRPTSMAVLRSVGLTETYADRIDNSIIETQADYFAVLADVFLLPLTHLDAAQHDQLWRRVWSQYEDFLARTASQSSE
ncbi:arylamine N-acetyltransferase family protein [Kribbella sp. NPDC055071]